MRSSGVAARVVTGYQGGEWNGEFWQIRSKDAHAWTEVWLPENKCGNALTPPQPFQPAALIQVWKTHSHQTN